MKNNSKVLTVTILTAIALACSSCSSKKSAYADDIMYSNNYTASKLSAANVMPTSGKPLTKDEAVKIALANNPNIQIAQLQAVAANAQFYGSFAALTPSVNTGAAVVKSPGSPAVSAAGVSGNMNVWNGLSSQMNILAAKSNAMSAEEMSMNARRILSQQTAFIYDTIIADKIKIKINMDNQAFWENQIKKLESTNPKDNKTKADILQFKANAEKAKSAVIKSIETFNNDKCALAVVMGMPNAKLPANIIFPDSPQQIKQTKNMPDVDYYLDQAVRQRPDLKASKDNVNAANYNLYGTYGQLSPTVDAGVGAAAVNVNNQTVGFTGAGASASANLNPAVPVTNIINAQAQKDITEEQLVQNYTQSMADVRTSYSNLTSDYAQEKILREQSDLAQQSRDLMAQEYDQGKTSIADVIQAQNNLVNTQLEYNKASADIAKSKAALDAAVGSSQEAP